MAVHAGFRRWDAGEPRAFDRGGAVAAVDVVAGDMPFLAEPDRLLGCDPRLGHPRRAIDHRRQREERGDDEHRAENTDARNRVRAAMKDLRHQSVYGRGRDDRGRPEGTDGARVVLVNDCELTAICAAATSPIL